MTVNMRSSGAVFTTQNPFPPDAPQTRTHYNPSESKKVSEQHKNLALSPVRFARSSQPEPPPQRALPSPEDLHFFGTSNRVVLCPLPLDEDQPSFSESWPSTEFGSSPPNTTVSPQLEAQGQALQPTKSLKSAATNANHEDSVLAKYIERFRHGRPQSRDERRRLSREQGEGQPFWWMSSSSPPLPSSTPTEGSERVLFPIRSDGTNHSPIAQTRHDTTMFPCKDLLDLSVLSLVDSTHVDPAEPEIIQLQERANQLLQRSDHSLSGGSIPISSEGLGGSDFSSPVSVDEPVRRPVVPWVMDLTTGEGSTSSASAVGPPGARPRAEDDILFQWRLRRKMEQARQMAETTSPSSMYHLPLASTRQIHEMHHSNLTTDSLQRMAPTFPSTPAVPAAHPAPHVLVPTLPISCPTVSKLQPENPAQAQTHFSHAILPSPLHHQSSSHSKWQPSQASPVPKPPNTSTETSAELGSKKESEIPSLSPSPGLSGSTQEELLVCCRGEVFPENGRMEVVTSRKKMVSSGQKKKAERRVGEGERSARRRADEGGQRKHGLRPDRASERTKESGRDGRGQKECQRSTQEGLSGNWPPPPSPIHSALGQVVSEVLFPATDSLSQSKSCCSLESTRSTPLAPRQSPAPPSSQSQPGQVIAQLLQEADDSDELEFAGDPLLQVLRQQRKWVKEQICEVDTLLDDLQTD